MRSKKLKTIACFAAMALTLGCIGGIGYAEPVKEISVKVDGKAGNFKNDKPYFEEETGRVLVPIDFVADNLGAKASWDSTTKTASITKNGNNIVLKAGDNKALVNNKELALDTKAVVKNDKPYIPLRFVAEWLGTKVGWFAATKTVDIKTTNNTTGKTIIQRFSKDLKMQTSFMVISKDGTVIVVDPYMMPEGTKADLILSTHEHYDHNDKDFYDRNTCKKSLYTVENFTEKGIKVNSIQTLHHEEDKTMPLNYIYVFEVDGMRIAHMGDVGHAQLTEEQLKALGKIDIAFMQLNNPQFSGIDVNNMKAFKLAEQIAPKIIIPTHTSKAATTKMGEILGELENVDDTLVISKEDVEKSKKKIINLVNN